MNTDSTISVLILNWSTSQLCLSHQSHEPQINMQLKRVLQVNQSWISKGKLVKKWVIQEMMCWISCSNIISGKKQCQRLQDAKHGLKTCFVLNELRDIDIISAAEGVLCSDCSHLHPVSHSHFWQAQFKWPPRTPDSSLTLPSGTGPGEK